MEFLQTLTLEQALTGYFGVILLGSIAILFKTAKGEEA